MSPHSVSKLALRHFLERCVTLAIAVPEDAIQAQEYAQQHPKSPNTSTAHRWSASPASMPLQKHSPRVSPSNTPQPGENRASFSIVSMGGSTAADSRNATSPHDGTTTTATISRNLTALEDGGEGDGGDAVRRDACTCANCPNDACRARMGQLRSLLLVAARLLNGGTIDELEEFFISGAPHGTRSPLFTTHGGSQAEMLMTINSESNQGSPLLIATTGGTGSAFSQPFTSPQSTNAAAGQQGRPPIAGAQFASSSDALNMEVSLSRVPTPTNDDQPVEGVATGGGAVTEWLQSTFSQQKRRRAKGSKAKQQAAFGNSNSGGNNNVSTSMTVTEANGPGLLASMSTHMLPIDGAALSTTDIAAITGRATPNEGGLDQLLQSRKVGSGTRPGGSIHSPPTASTIADEANADNKQQQQLLEASCSGDELAHPNDNSAAGELQQSPSSQHSPAGSIRRTSTMNSGVSGASSAAPAVTFDLGQKESQDSGQVQSGPSSRRHSIDGIYNRQNVHRRHSSSASMGWKVYLGQFDIPVLDVDSPDFNIFDCHENVFAKEDVKTFVGVCSNVLLRYSMVESLELDVAKLMRFLAAVGNAYVGTNPYHNAVHAADVLQTTHIYLTSNEVRDNFSDEEILCLLFSALIHDVGHLGMANPFLTKIDHPVARLYSGASPLEQMHALLGFWLMEQEENNFFDGSSVMDAEAIEEFKVSVFKVVQGTDMTKHSACIRTVKEILDDGQIEDDEIPVLMQAILHAADLSNPMKPKEIYHNWADRVLAEFWRQGDCEKALGLPLSPMCDRNTTLFHQAQAGFIAFIVRPLMREFEILLPPVWMERLDANEAYMRSEEAQHKDMSNALMMSARRWQDPWNADFIFAKCLQSLCGCEHRDGSPITLDHGDSGSRSASDGDLRRFSVATAAGAPLHHKQPSSDNPLNVPPAAAKERDTGSPSITADPSIVLRQATDSFRNDADRRDSSSKKSIGDSSDPDLEQAARRDSGQAMPGDALAVTLAPGSPDALQEIAFALRRQMLHCLSVDSALALVLGDSARQLFGGRGIGVAHIADDLPSRLDIYDCLDTHARSTAHLLRKQANLALEAGDADTAQLFLALLEEMFDGCSDIEDKERCRVAFFANAERVIAAAGALASRPHDNKREAGGSNSATMTTADSIHAGSLIVKEMALSVAQQATVLRDVAHVLLELGSTYTKRTPRFQDRWRTNVLASKSLTPALLNNRSSWPGDVDDDRRDVRSRSTEPSQTPNIMSDAYGVGSTHVLRGILRNSSLKARSDLQQPGYVSHGVPPQNPHLALRSGGSGLLPSLLQPRFSYSLALRNSISSSESDTPAGNVDVGNRFARIHVEPIDAPSQAERVIASAAGSSTTHPASEHDDSSSSEYPPALVRVGSSLSSRADIPSCGSSVSNVTITSQLSPLPTQSHRTRQQMAVASGTSAAPLSLWVEAPTPHSRKLSPIQR